MIHILNSDEPKKLLKSAKTDKVKIKHLCKAGYCGKCTVKVLSGNVSEPSKKEIKKLGQEAVTNGYRLSCVTEFTGEVKFETVS